MENIPHKIFLQIGEDCPDDADFDMLQEVTYSKGKINSNDIEYINASHSPLLDLFSPVIFNSIEELDQKINDFGVELHGLSSPVQKLRTFAGFMYRQHNVKSALYYLKMKRLVGKELELFIEADEFEHVKDNFYTWKNGNISALFVVEFTDN